jgi:teichuronic acid exporter
LQSLKSKTISGIVWSALDGISSSGISFLFGIVLARILSPEEFGLIGMVAFFLALFNSILDSGFSSALIQKNDAKSIDFNTTFYFNVVISIILYFLLYLLAPKIGIFFEQPELINITRCVGLILIFNAFALIQRTLLVKKVEFRTQTIISLISSFFSGLIGVAFALKGFGVWSLVYQQVSKHFINTILLWGFNTWRPKMEFSNDSFKQFFGFGSKLMLAGILDTLYRNSYYLIIGKFYTLRELGYFTRSEQFTSILSNNLSAVIQRVSYPTLCSIQEDKKRLKHYVQKSIKFSSIITFSSLLGLAAMAKSIVLVLIGIKWLPVVPYIQIMCLSGLFYSLSAINLNILLVQKRTDLFLKFEILKKIIGVFPVLIGIFIDIRLMLWGIVITSFLSYFFNSYYSERLINYSFRNQLIDILPIFLISLSVCILTWCLSLLKLSAIITLLLQFITLILLTISIYELFKNKSYLDLKNTLIEFTYEQFKS